MAIERLGQSLITELGVAMKNVKTMSFWLALVTALAAGFVTPNSSDAADFRIRLVRLQGKRVTIYHDDPKIAATSDVQVQIGATQCRSLSGEVLKPLRGGDAMTTLIVIDRGGTKKTGMGQHTDAIRNAVGGFLEGIVGKGLGDRAAIVDTPGRGREPGRLPPTRKTVDVKGFLANLPAPAGSGADIYGTANLALSELDKSSTRLGSVILISDGIDPTAAKDPAAVDNHKAFIREARRRGIPVAAIHVGRMAERRTGDPTRFRNGKARLQEVANQTNGDFRSVDSGGDLERNLRLNLDQLGAVFAKVMRTTCEICGTSNQKRGAILDVQFSDAGKVVGRSLASPPPTIDVPADNYGSCDTPLVAGGTEGKAGGGSGPSGGLSSCKVDPDCPSDSKCEAGTCQKRRTMRDILPYAAGGLLGLSLLFLVIGMQRKARKEREDAEARAEAARIDAAQSRDDSASARREAESERARAAMAMAAAADQGARPTAPAEPSVGVQLKSATGSVEYFDKAFGPGAHVLGSEPDCDGVFSTVTVSGHHVQLSIDMTGRAEVMDLGSSNGTFINSVPVAARQAVEIRPGDTVGISQQVQLQVFELSGAVGRAGGRGRTRFEE